MKISAWTHPKTGQRRIYVNSNLLDFGDKLFLTEPDSGPDCVKTDYEANLFVKCFSSMQSYGTMFGCHTSNKIDMALLAAGNILESMGLKGQNFEQLWEAAQ